MHLSRAAVARIHGTCVGNRNPSLTASIYFARVHTGCEEGEESMCTCYFHGKKLPQSIIIILTRLKAVFTRLQFNAPPVNARADHSLPHPKGINMVEKDACCLSRDKCPTNA